MYSRARSFDPLVPGLSDPQLQPKFVNLVPDALAPSFKYINRNNKFRVAAGPTTQMTGLIDPSTGKTLSTPLFGYGTRAGGFT